MLSAYPEGVTEVLRMNCYPKCPERTKGVASPPGTGVSYHSPLCGPMARQSQNRIGTLTRLTSRNPSQPPKRLSNGVPNHQLSSHHGRI